MEQEERFCDEVEAVSKFTYIGDWVSASGGCCDCQNKMWVG